MRLYLAAQTFNRWLIFRNSLVIVENMSVIAVGRKTIGIIAAAAAIPMAPVFFLALPFEEIIARLLGLRG